MNSTCIRSGWKKICKSFSVPAGNATGPNLQWIDCLASSSGWIARRRRSCKGNWCRTTWQQSSRKPTSRSLHEHGLGRGNAVLVPSLYVFHDDVYFVANAWQTLNQSLDCSVPSNQHIFGFHVGVHNSKPVQMLNSQKQLSRNHFELLGRGIAGVLHRSHPINVFK